VFKLKLSLVHGARSLQSPGPVLGSLLAPQRSSVPEPLCVVDFFVFIPGTADQEVRCVVFGALESVCGGDCAGVQLWAAGGVRRGSVPGELLPYPRNPTWWQYSAEYWLLADLLTEEPRRASHSAAVRVHDAGDADVFLVPFFCALSAELQLGEGHGRFRKKVEENRDYVRQRKVMDFVTQTTAWRRSGGRDHVFMLTGKQG
jgi:hypothetical protein